MAQKAVNPVPGRTFDDRGVSATAVVNKGMRKTGYRADANMATTQNSQDPDALVRVANDPRLA